MGHRAQHKSRTLVASKVWLNCHLFYEICADVFPFQAELIIASFFSNLEKSYSSFNVWLKNHLYYCLFSLPSFLLPPICLPIFCKNLSWTLYFWKGYNKVDIVIVFMQSSSIRKGRFISKEEAAPSRRNRQSPWALCPDFISQALLELPSLYRKASSNFLSCVGIASFLRIQPSQSSLNLQCPRSHLVPNEWSTNTCHSESK